MSPSSHQFGFALRVDNVNDALPQGLALVQEYGIPQVSRGTPFIEVPGPVTTIYETPERRVLFDTVRDANPFFHLMESLWILGGSNRVDVPSYFLNSIRAFSDDGLVFHGAYGHRMRHYDADQLGTFDGIDQVTKTITLLREKPDTRQAVISIWNPMQDLCRATKDMPCNDMLMFSIRDGRLDMQVCNRSNDVIWGAYGANAVQFSMIQELIATAVGVEVGRMVQHSWSYHVYPTNPTWQAFQADNRCIASTGDNPYTLGVSSYAIAATPGEALSVLDDCGRLCVMFEKKKSLILNPTERAKWWQSDYFLTVVDPLIESYNWYKSRNFEMAFEVLTDCAAQDWAEACAAWLHRRGLKASA